MEYLFNRTDINMIQISCDSRITKEEFYPYLAYIGTDGRPKDIFFDSVLFDVSSCGTTLADWESALDSFFEPDSGIQALDAAFGDVKLMLGLPEDFKCNVFFKAPTPQISLMPFGDINRDGITEKLLDTHDCLRAYTLFVDTVARRTGVLGLKNVSVSGYYIDNTGDEAFVKGCVRFLNERDYMTFTVSNDAERIQQIGFSASLPPAAVIAFERISGFAEMKKEWLGCVRIITCKDHTHLLVCAVSEEAQQRQKYDELYIFLHGDSSNSPADEDFADESKALPAEEPAGDYKEAPAAEPKEEPKEESKDEPKDEPKYEPKDEQHQEPPRRRKKTAKRCNATAEQKRALIGAGIAAAVLGVAYLIKKSTED